MTGSKSKTGEKGTFDLDPDLAAEVVKSASDSGSSLNDEIAVLLRRGLDAKYVKAMAKEAIALAEEGKKDREEINKVAVTLKKLISKKGLKLANDLDDQALITLWTDRKRLAEQEDSSVR